jgi:hypothetical protein
LGERFTNQSRRTVQATQNQKIQNDPEKRMNAHETLLDSIMKSVSILSHHCPQPQMISLTLWLDKERKKYAFMAGIHWKASKILSLRFTVNNSNPSKFLLSTIF